MKKILLATTLLAASAGYASADIAWGASAAAGIGADGDTTATTAAGNGNAKTILANDGAYFVYSNVNLAVTLSGATDGGLTFGASFDTTAGTTYDLADDNGFNDNGGTFGMPTIFISGALGKLAISDDNFDFYDDSNGGGDVEYTNTFGAVSVGVIADIDAGNTSLSLGYTAGNLALSLNADTFNLQNISATYTMGTIAVTAATDESSNSSLKLAYAGTNGMTASAQYNTSDSSVDVAAGYSANGLSLNADTNSVSGAWTVTGGYDLGGGLAVSFGTNYTEDMMIGATMAF